ncbi:hypothetical protein GW916_07650 [bacterium]|nr:hypothetical protein [bacterium]
MKSILLFLLCTTASATSFEEVPTIQFDSGHSIALNGKIEFGTILVETNSSEEIESSIRQQLRYTVGQLNGMSGVADLNRILIQVKEIQPVGHRSYLVIYSADLFVAWPRELKIPGKLTLILPESTEYDSEVKFYQNFSSPECVDDQTHDLSFDVFWYYYRPNKSKCPLRHPSPKNGAVYLDLELSLSSENTSGKSPEYKKVWEDGRLIVTAIFGKNEADSQTDDDAGVWSYLRMHHDLLKYYGEPIKSSLEPGESPTHKTSEIEMQFSSESGPVFVHLFLVDHIRYTTERFKRRYNELTRTSDFIAYAGHSGLGANIRALAKMGSFRKGQYQIFLVNGCDTFAYVDDALVDAHLRVNPLNSPYKFIDLITNAMPAFFYSNSRSVMNVVKALTERTLTYREILERFDRHQRAVVIGEEDNED